MKTPILFVDRDGTLIQEPPDFQVDDYAKLRFVDGVLPALARLRDAGYEFVMVSNQDGLGTPAYPEASFEGPQSLLVQLFESQGLRFRDILIDRSLPSDNSPARKPGIGMVMSYVRDRSIDWSRSAMVGDRDSDAQFARNLGIRSFLLRTPQFNGDWEWPAIADALTSGPRTAQVSRRTNETRIEAQVDLDRVAPAELDTGLGFFDHMLEQLGKHGGFALKLRCEGDLRVDEHHTVEDSALALGQALREALGDKRGIGRYGFTLPMDEALATAALDLSGRPCFVFRGKFTRDRVGELPTELVPHFFRSLCEAAGMNLHLQVEGDNAHHQVEACFKAVGRALRPALRREGSELPSTKGQL